MATEDNYIATFKDFKDKTGITMSATSENRCLPYNAMVSMLTSSQISNWTIVGNTYDFSKRLVKYEDIIETSKSLKCWDITRYVLQNGFECIPIGTTVLFDTETNLYKFVIPYDQSWILSVVEEIYSFTEYAHVIIFNTDRWLEVGKVHSNDLDTICCFCLGESFREHLGITLETFNYVSSISSWPELIDYKDLNGVMGAVNLPTPGYHNTLPTSVSAARTYGCTYAILQSYPSDPNRGTDVYTDYSVKEDGSQAFSAILPPSLTNESWSSFQVPVSPIFYASDIRGCLYPSVDYSGFGIQGVGNSLWTIPYKNSIGVSYSNYRLFLPTPFDIMKFAARKLLMGETSLIAPALGQYAILTGTRFGNLVVGYHAVNNRFLACDTVYTGTANLTNRRVVAIPVLHIYDPNLLSWEYL